MNSVMPYVPFVRFVTPTWRLSITAILIQSKNEQMPPTSVHCIKFMQMCQKRGNPNRISPFLVPRLRREMIRCAQTQKSSPVPFRAFDMRIWHAHRIWISTADHSNARGSFFEVPARFFWTCNLLADASIKAGRLAPLRLFGRYDSIVDWFNLLK